jgi:hypothetical protein
LKPNILGVLMPRTDAEKKLLDKATKETIKNLKKIIASGGRLDGVFYFTGNKLGDDAALVVNLTAKDRKGGAAASLGKKLRKSIPDSKFKRGMVVLNDAKKLEFQLVKGNSSASEMRKTFKDNFAKQAGMAFIKKAVFTGKDVSGQAVAAEDAEDKTAGDLTDLELTEQERFALLSEISKDAELKALMNDQASTRERARQNRDMMRSFLAAEKEEEEHDEFVRNEKMRLEDRIAALEEQQQAAMEGMGTISVQERVELIEARTEHARLCANGAPVSQGVGDSLSGDTLYLSRQSSQTHLTLSDQQHRRIAEELFLKEQVFDGLSEPEQQAFVLEHQDLIVALESSLNELFETLTD